jgi:hypothetical protein
MKTASSPSATSTSVGEPPSPSSGGPPVAARLHAAERTLADPDPAVRDHAIQEAADIVQAAYREAAGD